MEYNTKRPKLQITDYGRNVYRMIEFAKTIPDRKLRTQAAEAIVKMMELVNPHAKESEDYHRKLWDHLMIMSNWQLDVDCPYALTRSESVQFSPRRLAYKSSREMHFRHYGRCLEDMINAVADMPDNEDKELLKVLLTAQVKKSYLSYNLDVNSTILEAQMKRLSKGRLSASEVDIPYQTTPTPIAENAGTKKKKKKKKKSNSQQ